MKKAALRWLGEYDMSADEMPAGTEKKKDTKTQEAKDMICAMLAGGKQALSEEIDREALNKGISTRTVEGRRKLHWME